MTEFKDKVALITGAANGFGKIFAIEAVKRGMKVAIVDIDRIITAIITSDTNLFIIFII